MAARPRLFARTLLALALVGASAMGCGEQDVDLQILVDRADGSTFGDVAALRLGVRTACDNTPVYFETYELNDETLQQHIKTAVPTNTPFSVIIFACAAVAGCADEPIAKGCNVLNDGVPENRETPAIVSVLLRDLDDTTQACPIEPPCPTGS